MNSLPQLLISAGSLDRCSASVHAPIDELHAMRQEGLGSFACELAEFLNPM